MADRLALFMDGAEYGALEQRSADPADLALSYAPSWLERRDAFPLSVLMPLPHSGGTPTYQGPLVYNWFLNLFPEAERLVAFGDALGVADVDVFGLLAKAGGDLAGALSAYAEGSSPPVDGSQEYLPLDEVALVQAIERLPERPLLAGEEGVRMSIAGQQDKLGVATAPGGGILLPRNGAASTHILKPEPIRLYGAVDNELFCLRLAKAVGLPAAEATAGRAGGRPFLLVRRYDRRVEDGRVARLHQEDFCQALGLPPHRKYEAPQGLAGRGATLADCFRLVSRAVTPPAVARLRLLDAAVLNILADNVDAHSKNYSLLLGPGGAVSLAPLYDVMVGGVFPHVTPNMAMRIAGKNRGAHLRRWHWESFAREVGLSPSGVVGRVQSLARRAAAMVPRVAQAMAVEATRPEILKKVAEVVSDRCRRVMANLAVDAPDRCE